MEKVNKKVYRHLDTITAFFVAVLLISNYIFKVGVEVLFTPLTYKIVAFLKRKEGEDYYDKETRFNPFKLKA